MNNIIAKDFINTRNIRVNKIKDYNGKFNNDFEILFNDLKKEISDFGIENLCNHLRLCGNIPESYKHDSTEEKLYSKYTDGLLSIAFEKIGLKSLVIAERSDMADVECFNEEYDFVADAKAFRLSRTAKNQKDFKVSAMNRWKHGKKYAMVVCPSYQLPKSSSQIYNQSITYDVMIFTYSHICMLLMFNQLEGELKTQKLLLEIFQSIACLSPSKDSFSYRKNINSTFQNFSPLIGDLWKNEKIASQESIEIGKNEGLIYLSQERKRIVNLTHEEAISQLLNINKIENKIKTISSIKENGLLNII